MKLIRINKDSIPNDLINLWNKEFGNIYPITIELFQRNIQNICEDSSFIAIDDDKIIGFIISKIWNESYQIDAYNHVAWISLIYVVPKKRRQGIGTILLNEAISYFDKKEINMVHLGRDLYNFFPGLPIDMTKNIDFFIKNGFQYSYQTHDLISRNDKILPLKNLSSYTFRTASLKDKEMLISFIQKNWPGRWTFEAIDYFNHGGNGDEYFICLNSENEICAFSKICYPNTSCMLMSNSHTWKARFNALGGIGPLGVDPAYRGNHLGFDIVAGSVNQLINRHVTEMIIDWTGLLEFYRQFGFEVWKTYSYLSRKKD